MLSMSTDRSGPDIDRRVRLNRPSFKVSRSDAFRCASIGEWRLPRIMSNRLTSIFTRSRSSSLSCFVSSDPRLPFTCPISALMAASHRAINPLGSSSNSSPAFATSMNNSSFIPACSFELKCEMPSTSICTASGKKIFSSSMSYLPIVLRRKDTTRYSLSLLHRTDIYTL